MNTPLDPPTMTSKDWCPTCCGTGLVEDRCSCGDLKSVISCPNCPGAIAKTYAETHRIAAEDTTTVRTINGWRNITENEHEPGPLPSFKARVTVEDAGPIIRADATAVLTLLVLIAAAALIGAGIAVYYIFN